MKQVIQNYKTGKLELADVPLPMCSSNAILVRNIASLVSIGTEKSMIDLAKQSLLGKAKMRPDLVKRFLEKAKKEGFLKTFNEALGRLDEPKSLGYSSAGIVCELGKNVNKFSVGDKVACIGAGFASHSEYITVPENLAYKMPESVSFEEAAFGMLGIIAMHGIRTANISFGEKVAVIGLGLIGQLTVQILQSYGLEVIGFDIDETKVLLAKKNGLDLVSSNIEEFKNFCNKITLGNGVDSVIITVATKSNEPVDIAVDIARFKAKVVLVGVADIHPNRNEMWHKEVEIVVSKAGGAGSLDPIYELNGIDYPIGLVRWTENRNLEEFLRLLALKKVKINNLISHKFKIDEAESVYNDIMSDKTGKYVGVIFNYPENNLDISLSYNVPLSVNNIQSNIVLGVIGAGLFGRALFLPILSKQKNIKFHTLSTSSSMNAYSSAKKFGFQNASTDYNLVIKNNEINSIIILTPHSLHYKMVLEGINSNKNVFVEKPLCINEKELNEIIDAYKKNPKNILMVGYNRRFSPHSIKAKEYLKNRLDPLVITYRVNAGFVDSNHWVHLPKEGGDRIVGEVCHFVDLMQFFTNSNPISVFAEKVAGNNKTIVNKDNIAIILKFDDGSIGNIIYTGSGDKAFSREHIEIFSEGKTITIRDFKETLLFKNGKRNKFQTFNQEIGYNEELNNFFNTIQGKETLKISPKEIFYSTLTVFKIQESISKKNFQTIKL